MRRLNAFLFCITILLSFSACTPKAKEPATQGQYGLWFAVHPDGDRANSAMIAREDRTWEEEPAALDLMKALLEGPYDKNLISPFPEGVSVRGAMVSGDTGIARVDLSRNYRDLTGFDLTVADYCITLTLCQLPRVETVVITVEGEEISSRDRQSLQAGDVLLSGDPMAHYDLLQ